MNKIERKRTKNDLFAALSKEQFTRCLLWRQFDCVAEYIGIPINVQYTCYVSSAMLQQIKKPLLRMTQEWLVVELLQDAYVKAFL